MDSVQTSSRDIYQHFDKPVDGRATCKQCQRSISCFGQSSSNLHKHLAVQKIVLEKMRSVRKKAEQPTLQVTKTRRSTTMTKTEQESCDLLLVCLLCRDYLPFQIVVSPRFKAFVYSLNPRYRLPTRATSSSEMVPSKIIQNLRFHPMQCTNIQLTTPYDIKCESSWPTLTLPMRVAAGGS